MVCGKVSDSTLKTFMKLNVFAGMSADTLNEMHRMAKLTGQDAGVMATKMADTASQSIKAYKVNVSQKEVMMGVSKLSNEMKLNFGGSAEGLTKAFVKAKSLGFELEKVKGISQSLLNIEDSIAAEMEAELLTGKDLNLEKAREYALNHNVEGLMGEIAKNYGSVAEFQKMNVIQQEAAAKAIGMSSDELANVLAGSKANKSENQQLLDTQKQGVAAMSSMLSLQEKINAREEAEAAAKAKSASNMEKMNEFMHKMAMVSSLNSVGLNSNCIICRFSIFLSTLDFTRNNLERFSPFFSANALNFTASVVGKIKQNFPRSSSSLTTPSSSSSKGNTSACRA
jgi:hypothetical protein